MSIPKVINYCWFGRNPKTELMEKCISSWKKYCPDYEIIEWNEDNFDVNFCPYASKAYEQKRYGFLADVVRLKIIYDNGGIYLDTDVELKRNIDELLDNKAWFAYGTATEINTGSGFGTEKNNWLVKELLDNYQSFGEHQKYEVCTKLDTEIFIKSFPNFASDHDVEQDFDGIKIINNIWHYNIHHYTNTWVNNRQKLLNKILGLFRKNNKVFYGE